MRNYYYALAMLALLCGQQAHAQQADVLMPSPPPAIEQAEAQPHYTSAVLQGLNKVTARISKLDVSIETPAHFGNLEISLERCWKAPSTEQPENAALLQVMERKPDEAAKMIFHGWMFSSSPSLSGLEHPVYDLIVLSCGERTAEKQP